MSKQQDAHGAWPTVMPWKEGYTVSAKPEGEMVVLQAVNAAEADGVAWELSVDEASRLQREIVGAIKAALRSVPPNV